MDSRSRLGAWIALAIIALALFWTYAHTIGDLIKEWEGNPNYSVGMIVPFAAVYLLWADRDRLRRVSIRPAWGGLVILLVAQLVRLAGLAALYESAERYSILLTIFGLVVLVGGWDLFYQVKWILMLLILMIPFPGSIHNLISSPLQDLSTNGAVATLELMGISVEQEGHQMVLNGRVSLGVAEACSGLRMLTAFIFVSSMLAYVIRRPMWQKIMIVLSAVPIAILANLIRLVATALLYAWVSDEMGKRFFHDFAGWTMMPLAIALLALELWVLSLLEVKEPHEPVQASV
jgi:exosortase